MAVVAAGLLIAAVLLGNGSSDDRLLWVGGAALVVAGVVAVRRLPRPSSVGLVFLTAFGAFVLWSGLSILWSVEPDRSWAYFNRSVVYFAFALVGLAFGAVVRRAPTVAAGTLAASFGAVLAWALLGKVFPDLDPDGERVARLRGTLGYWNALGLVAVMAAPLALWAAARRDHRHAVRAAGALLFFLATVTLPLTYSRGGALVALVAIGLWLLIGTPRLESVVTAVGAGAVGLVVAFVGFALPGISEEQQPESVRTDDGLVFGLVLVVGAAVVFGAALLASRWEAGRPLEPEVRRRLGRAAAVAAAAVLVAALAAGVVRAGNPVDWASDAFQEFSDPIDPTTEDDPTRFVELSSNTRWNWWEDALEIFREHPVVGAGAGAYDVARRPFREDRLAPAEPHSIPLQFLAELGVIGLLLFGTAVAAAGTGIVVALRSAGDERPAVAALTVVVTAYAVHSLVEFDWDFVVLSGPVLLLVGLLLGRGATTTRLATLPALATGAAVAVVIASLALPWASARKVEDAREAIADPERSAQLAEEAHDLNPLAVEPLLLWADAEEARRDFAESRRLLVEAVELQPENPITWRELGEFELEVLRREDFALKYLARARELDPEDPITLQLLSRFS